MYLSAVLLVSLLVGGLSLFVAFKTLKRFGWFFAWLRGTIGICFLLLACGVFWAALDLSDYSELLDDKPIAAVSFKKIGDQHYTATISYYTDRQGGEFDIYGDQWQVDARIVRWSGILAALGAKPGYRLDRLSGRYYSLENERTKPRSVFSLQEQPAYRMDVWKALHTKGSMVPGIDAVYGSAAYLPMADSASFQLSLSYNGLTAKPANKIAEQAVAEWR